MGISMLAAGSLAAAIGEVFGNVLTWLMNSILVPILKALINAVVLVIKYIFGGIFYEISVFLLQLIDFVETLFRSLAGLENNAGSTFFFSIDGGEGDLLLQMLRSQEVLQAFYACCIVGIFLLIITTIFQMIKVEYTSEGAQNSKTSILGKSLKSVANLLLIPVLVIFGVLIGNQVLDLIDTATGGGQGTKISGVLFVTAASDAMWNSVEQGNIKVDVVDDLLAVGLTCAFSEVNWTDYSEYVVKEIFYGDPSEPHREEVESGFMKCSVGYRYASAYDVSKYYNIFEINYLVLIFGGCIILKCLFFTAFGMIDRLYQCVALFIVSPMVVGMTPVKDSLGSWRSKFISKALSAYGSIIALNLFFILVTVFLNIDITMNMSKGNILYFSTSFMEGLIKSIFVIVGALMIEKLAGDLGQYFGGGNAMSDGKGLAGEATKGLATAAKVGTGIALGGAGIAAKLGGFVGKGTKGLVTGQGLKGFKESALGQDIGNAVKSNFKASKKTMNAHKAEVAVAEGELADAIKREDKDAEIKAREKLEKANKAVDDDVARNRLVRDKRNTAKNAVRQIGMDGLRSVIPGTFTNAQKTWNDALEKGNSYSDETKQMYENVKDADKKRATERFENDFINKKAVERNKQETAQITSEAITKELEGSLSTDRDSYKKAISTYNAKQEEISGLEEVLDKLQVQLDQMNSERSILESVIVEKKKNNEDTALDQSQLNQIIGAINNQKSEIGRQENKKSMVKSEQGEAYQILSQANKDIRTTINIDGMIDNDAAMEQFKMGSKIDEFKRKIMEEVKKGATKEDLDKIIKDQIKAWSNKEDENLVKRLKEAVEKIKSEIGK